MIEPIPLRGAGDISVLVIEDNEDDQAILADLLSNSERSQVAAPQFSTNSRFHLVFAHTLQKAKEVIFKTAVDIVLLDLGLPDSKGLGSVNELLGNKKDVPVIVLTGISKFQALEMTSFAEGVEDFLLKSGLERNHLIKAIRHAIERNQQKQKLAQLNQQLEAMVISDPLTDLLNRRGLEQALVREMAMMCREQSSMAAILVDLDNFKHTNDHFGYDIGNQVLKQVAQTMKNSLRATDYVGRLGGDEFLIYLPSTSSHVAGGVAEKMRREIQKISVSYRHEIIKTTASFGIISVADPNFSIEEILARVFVAVKQSKSTGKDRVFAIRADGSNQLLTETDEGRIVESFFENDAFYAVFQPIFSIPDLKVEGYELLSRAKIKGLQGPDDFFHLAFKNKMLTQLDQHCFRMCLAASKVIPSSLRLHLNIFPSTLLSVSTEQLLADLPEGLPRSKIYLEINEQQIIGDPECLVDPVQNLRKAGICVGIDDVGFGKSSLESLILLQPDFIKIDKNFTKNIYKDISKRQVLRRLVSVAKMLKSEVVAEGIETEEDLKVMEAMRIKLAQGYFLAKPSKRLFQGSHAETKRAKRIMIIEDEEDLRKSTAYFLRKQGFEVIEAETGKRGLEVLKDRIPDLILLDLMLPGLPGEEVCKKIKEESDDEWIRDIPIVMVTSKSQDADRIIGKSFGACRYLTKPFDFEDLLQLVHQVLQEPSKRQVSDDNHG